MLNLFNLKIQQYFKINNPENKSGVHFLTKNMQVNK